MRTNLLLTAVVIPVAALADDRPEPVVSHQDIGRFQDAGGRIRLLETPEDWTVRRRSILRGFQEAAGPLPSRAKLPDLDLRIRDTQTFGSIRRVTGTILAEPGDRLPLDIYLPRTYAGALTTEDLLNPTSATRVPGILALHPTGRAGKRIIGGENPRPNRQYAHELAERGYVVVCPDYASYGEYAYDFDTDRYTSGTMKGVFNHMRCVDLLSSLSMVDSNRLGVIGHSLGGSNAIFVSVFDERLRVVVSSCGWTPFHHYFSGNLKGWISDVYMPLIRDRYDLDPDRVPFDFYELVAALAPRTFVSVSPVNDDNFDVTGVRRVIPAAQQIWSLLDAPKELILLTPECGHDYPTDTRLTCYEIIDRVLDFTPRSTDPDYSAELPRIPPTEPEDALETFEVVPGYEMQLTAAEPLVTDPVAMDFDADGALYVVEMKGYSEQADEYRGQIRRLVDRDNDGVFDFSRIFAENLSWPTAIGCFDDGVFVGVAPEILYLKDNDGDGTADQWETVFTGFGRSNVQGLLNSFHWGQDGRIYGATSSSGGNVHCPRHPERPALSLRSRDFSFDPLTLDIREETGGAQHGISFDDFGNRFVCSNSDHAQAIVFDQRYLAANPRVPGASARLSIARDGGQASVFRISPVEPWRIVRTRLRVSGRVKGPVEGGGRPAGYFTGATGITVYRGDAWPEEMRGQLIVGDVGSNLVHRKRLTATGTTWVAERMDFEREFVASVDNWFRPVQFVNGPDGCLHVLDMYREIIEHPASLPPEIKTHLDLNSGRDRGRLYRIHPVGWSHRPTPQLSMASPEELIVLLSHPNAWHAETAHRLLIERADTGLVPQLKALAEGKSVTGAIRALSLMRRLGAMMDETIVAALGHDHPRVRERAVLLGESFQQDDVLARGIASLVTDPDARVRLQAGFSLGMRDKPDRLAPLVALLKNDADDRWIRTAAVTSLRELEWDALQMLLADERFLDSAAGPLALRGLVALALSRPNAPAADSAAIVIGRADGRPALQEHLLRAVLRTRPDWHDHMKLRKLADQIVDASERKLEHSRSVHEQIIAIRALSLSTWERHGPILLDLLQPGEPPEVQQAALATLAEFGDVRLAEQLIQKLEELSPKLRESVKSVLLSRTQWTSRFLRSVVDGQLSPSAIQPTDLRRLTEHPQSDVRETAQQLLDATKLSSRDEVLRSYRPALAIPGDPKRGEQVYRRTCSVCHRVGNTGAEVGPSLLSAKSRGMEFVLLNVLDPNREVLPAWHDYVAVTAEGLSFNGVLVSESAISVTLRQAEAKESTVLRAEIEVLHDTGRSLMPENLEREVSVEAMADLFAWLRTQQ